MAHLLEEIPPEQRVPKSNEESRAWEHIQRVFGRPPSSIRCISESGQEEEIYFVRVESWGNRFEFICVDGLLVGIPPKRRWEK